jgi:hypothetical protein
MPIPIICPCGRSLRAKDEAAGRKVRCPNCGNVLAVPQPSKDAEDEALDLLLADTPAEDRPRQREPADTAKRVQEKVRRPPETAPPTPSRPSWARNPDKPKTKKKPRKVSRERSGGGIAIHPSIITGALMMVGATIWFVLGLAAGYIYFYPPVMFVLGIGAIIRGFTGQE